MNSIDENNVDFTHFNGQGHAYMVDVSNKEITRRTASATGKVLMSRETLELIKSGGIKKGDVLTVAQIAGIMGAKKTSDIIVMCHPIQTDGTDISFIIDEEECAVIIKANVTCNSKTGVEMEALTAVSIAALNIYDMCKAVQKDMTITGIRLEEKTGGIHGDFRRRIM